jgi:hypothetical protein
MILRGSYPNDAWKLEGTHAREMTAMMLAIFRNADDADVMKAVEKCVIECETLPSMSTIRKVISSRKNAIPEYKALPGSDIENPDARERIQRIINEAQEKHRKQKSGEYHPAMSKKIVDFAKRKFPDMADELIEKNYDVFEEGVSLGMRMDGNPMGFQLNKKTGDVSLWVIL